MAEKEVRNIEVRKQMLKLQIRQQEMEIEHGVKNLGTYFTFPAVKNTVIEYVLNNPETAFRAGLIAVNIFSKLFQGTKRKTKKRTTKKK